MSAISRVQDTAIWVAAMRALESERTDALFHDPFARRLAGPRADAVLRSLGKTGSWPFVARTVLLDRLLSQAIAEGVDAVLDLAAGLDSRAWRLPLPAELTWIEVDHADVLDAKAAALRDERPRCRLESRAVDLADPSARLELFDDVRARGFRKLLVLTEGLLYYLADDDALALARDIRALAPHRWIVDLHNAATRDLVARRTDGVLQGTARMQFAPDDGPSVFAPLGWETLEAISVFKTAGKLGRLPFPMSLFARLPERPYGTPGRPWSGVCVLRPRSPAVGAPPKPRG